MNKIINDDMWPMENMSKVEFSFKTPIYNSTYE